MRNQNPSAKSTADVIEGYDKTSRPHHAPRIANRDVRFTLYVGKGHKGLFWCPECGRQVWQHLNFLGQRTLVCSGDKWTKEAF